MVFLNSKIETFKKREKRFFLHTNEGKLVYCPNTGKMTDLLVEGALCGISPKETGMSFQWNTVNINGEWIGVNTQVPNILCKDFLPKYFNSSFKSEFKINNIRVDFANHNTLIEVKYLHYVLNNQFIFPDCITTRGTKQLNVLSSLQDWNRYVIYIAQRKGNFSITSLKEIDPDYFNAVQNAKNKGVKFLGFNCLVSYNSVEIKDELVLI